MAAGPGRAAGSRDKFGISWQVVPTGLGKMMSNPKGGNTGRLMETLLGMGKLDIAALEGAYRTPR